MDRENQIMGVPGDDHDERTMGGPPLKAVPKPLRLGGQAPRAGTVPVPVTHRGQAPRAGIPTAPSLQHVRAARDGSR